MTWATTCRFLVVMSFRDPQASHRQDYGAQHPAAPSHGPGTDTTQGRHELVAVSQAALGSLGGNGFFHGRSRDVAWSGDVLHPFRHGTEYPQGRSRWDHAIS